MSTPRTIRWGIVGAGRIAGTFARDMAFVDHSEVTAVASRDPDRAAAFAAEFDIPDSHVGYQSLFESDQVDAIYIATPHTEHLQNAQAAMAAGKAVLCEKPITTCAEDCRSLIDASASAGTYLMEAMWTHFLPAIRQAMEWVTAGRIGPVLHLKADFGYPLPYDPECREYDASLAGGCLLDMGIYPIAMATLVLGPDPRISSVRARHAPNGVEDDVVMLLEYGDSLATLATSFRAKLQNWACIVGRDGYIAIPDFWRATECRLFELDQCIDRFEDDRRGSGFEYQIHAVCEDLRAGRLESDVVPHQSSLALQSVMDAVRARF